jgi:hypothetical protein
VGAQGEAAGAVGGASYLGFYLEHLPQLVVCKGRQHRFGVAGLVGFYPPLEGVLMPVLGDF